MSRRTPTKRKVNVRVEALFLQMASSANNIISDNKTKPCKYDIILTAAKLITNYTNQLASRTFMKTGYSKEETIQIQKYLKEVLNPLVTSCPTSPVLMMLVCYKYLYYETEHGVTKMLFKSPNVRKELDAFFDAIETFEKNRKDLSFHNNLVRKIIGGKKESGERYVFKHSLKGKAQPYYLDGEKVMPNDVVWTKDDGFLGVVEKDMFHVTIPTDTDLTLDTLSPNCLVIRRGDEIIEYDFPKDSWFTSAQKKSILEQTENVKEVLRKEKERENV